MTLTAFFVLLYMCSLLGLRINGTPWRAALVASVPGALTFGLLCAALGV